MATKETTSKTGRLKSRATKWKQKYILESYRDNPNFARIAKEMECSETYVRKLYQKALDDIIVLDVEKHRKLELYRLDKLFTEAVKILDAFHPLVNSGSVVHDIVDDENGNPLIDPETGDKVTTRLWDVSPKLNAIEKALKIMDRRAKFLGLDAPQKTALTDPTGEKEASLGSELTEEEFAMFKKHFETDY